MRVLIVLTYYRPHVSGLTIYVERLARELARRGHDVTVLTARHDRALPRREVVDGVVVERVPVLARVSKGVLMPVALRALRRARTADVVSIHLPQFDGGMVALAARLRRRRVVLTYHCDLRLPRGWVNRVADRVTFAMNWLAAMLSHSIVANTDDYARHSSLLKRFPGKITVIPPPVPMAPPDPGRVEARRTAAGIGSGLGSGMVPLIGSAARLATEKGVEHLVAAVPLVSRELPGARVAFAGAHRDVVGEQAYRDRLRPAIAALGDRWSFLGVLDQEDMADYFGSLDVLVVSSINSTESFGLVQVEAMLCGTPVVATDLPGVRQPVRMTGMGLVVPAADAGALARAIVEVVTNRERYLRPRAEVAEMFDPGSTVDSYLRLFRG